MPARPASRVRGLMLIAVLTVIGVAGLWTEDSYRERWIGYDAASATTRIGHHGLVQGELTLPAGGFAPLRLELAIVPALPDTLDFGILLQLDSPGSDDPLIVGQWRDRLIVMQGRDYAGRSNRPRLVASLGERLGHPVVVEIEFSGAATRLRIDGASVAGVPPAAFRLRRAANRLTIGNAPEGGKGWEGGLRRVRLWRGDPRTGTAVPLRDYRFDRNHLPSLNDDSPHGSALRAPPPGRFPEYRYIRVLDAGVLLTTGRRDLIVNLLGFVPLGMALGAVLEGRRHRERTLPRTLGVTAAGFLVSLTIESLQTLLPGRNPHVHDVVLNTAGTLLGALVWSAWAHAARRLERPRRIDPPQAQ